MVVWAVLEEALEDQELEVDLQLAVDLVLEVCLVLIHIIPTINKTAKVLRVV